MSFLNVNAPFICAEMPLFPWGISTFTNRLPQKNKRFWWKRFAKSHFKNETSSTLKTWLYITVSGWFSRKNIRTVKMTHSIFVILKCKCSIHSGRRICFFWWGLLLLLLVNRKKILMIDNKCFQTHFFEKKSSLFSKLTIYNGFRVVQ